MEYTTLALAKELKISPRTLRYYDQIGLVKPKIRMMSGRCIYGLSEMLILIHILILRDFGFSLRKIQSILKESERYRLCALKAQKAVLLKEQSRLNKNLELIDFMIEQSKQEKKMDTYDGKMPNPLEALHPKCEYVQYFDESYVKEKAVLAFEIFREEAGDEYCDAFKKKSSQMDLQGAQLYGARIGQFLNKIQEAMDKPADSKEVQELMATQWEVLKMVYPDTDSKRVYLAIRNQVCHNPITDFEPATVPLFVYISKAMDVFAELNFSAD